MPPLSPPIPAGDLLRITHLARGADASGTLLLDSVVSGSVPESIGEATLLLQVPVLPRACGCWAECWGFQDLISPFSRTSASATCGQGQGGSAGARCRASCRTGASSVPAATTPSSTSPLLACSRSGCSTSRPGRSKPPLIRPQRSSASSSAPPSMQVTRGMRVERKVLGSLTGPGWLRGRKGCFPSVARPFSATSACFPGDQCPPGFVLGPQQLHCLGTDLHRGRVCLVVWGCKVPMAFGSSWGSSAHGAAPGATSLSPSCP